MDKMVKGKYFKIRKKYGERYLNKGRIGILLDMNQGILAFGM